MKLQRFQSLSTLGRLALLAGTIGAVSALASFHPAASKADPATVIHKDGGCFLPGADADGNLVSPGGLGYVWSKVENDNKVTMKCRGANISNLSGRTVQFRGFSCGIFTPTGPFVFTSDTHATLTADGYCTMTCTYVKP